MNCVYWANGGHLDYEKSEIIFAICYNRENRKLDIIKDIYFMSSPFSFNNMKSVNKFLSIEGIEDMIKEYYKTL
jgi:hypothetical protein